MSERVSVSHCVTHRETHCVTQEKHAGNAHLQKQPVVLHDELVEARDIGETEAGAQRHLKHTHMRDPRLPVRRLLCLVTQKR